MKNLIENFAYRLSLFCRWNQTPLSEAMRHRHYAVVKYIKEYLDNNPNAGNERPYEFETTGVTAV